MSRTVLSDRRPADRWYFMPSTVMIRITLTWISLWKSDRYHLLQSRSPKKVPPQSRRLSALTLVRSAQSGLRFGIGRVLRSTWHSTQWRQSPVLCVMTLSFSTKSCRNTLLPFMEWGSFEGASDRDVVKYERISDESVQMNILLLFCSKFKCLIAVHTETV